MEFGVGAALDVIVALDFERNVIRPALRAFDKAVIERGHGSWKYYRKKHLNRRPAETAEKSNGQPIRARVLPQE